MISSHLKTVRSLLSHPLNRHRKVAALTRYIRWQVGSRILPGSVAIPFVNGSQLLVAPGMAGATGNVYCGLHEFEEMAFVLHALQPGDLFFDVGANIGSYSVLAASRGARVVGFEPIPSAYERFRDNIAINKFEGLISPRNQGVGERAATLRFTAGLDTVNHVATQIDTSDLIEVEIICLDSLMQETDGPTIMKIDVEGFEMSVLNGAARVLNSSRLIAVILELNRSGKRYGVEDCEIYSRITSFGFSPYNYRPFERTLLPLVDTTREEGNMIFVKDLKSTTERISNAPKVFVNGKVF